MKTISLTNVMASADELGPCTGNAQSLRAVVSRSVWEQPIVRPREELTARIPVVFNRAERLLEDTVAFAVLAVAGGLMLFFAVSAMLDFAAGHDAIAAPVTHTAPVVPR